MNAPEAKQFGLIDEVMGDVSDVITLSRAEVTMSLFTSAKQVAEAV